MKQVTFTCAECRGIFTITPYFGATRITVTESPYDGTRSYAASATGVTICPYCGKTNTKEFESQIHKEDIVDLATRDYE